MPPPWEMLLLLTSLLTSLAQVQPPSSGDYVSSRAKRTRDALLARLHAVPENGGSAPGEAAWTNWWSRPSQRRPRAVALFDETFVVDERRRVLSAALSLDGAGEDAPEELRLNLASPTQPIELAKSYSRSGLALLVVCQRSCCTHGRVVNGSSGLRLEGEQAIDHPALVPVDAAFFAHADEAHLVIAYDGPAPRSKIFRWTGTRMLLRGEIVLERAPTSVVACPSGPSTTLLLFTLRSDPDADGACVVYQLGDDHSVRRLRSAVAPAVASIYPYARDEQRLFLSVDGLGSAAVLRWNGAAAAFERLANLSDVQQPLARPMRTLQVDDETLLLAVGRTGELCVYKMEDRSATLLTALALPSGQRVAEISAWRRGDAIMLLLVKINVEGTWQTELWQLSLGPVAHTADVVEDDYAKARACLRELKDALDSRAASMLRFQMARSRRRSFDSNGSGQLSLGDLKIDGGRVSLVEFREQPGVQTVASPRQTREKLMGLRRRASALADDVRKTGAVVSGNVSVAGETRFEELRIDSLEASYVNGRRADFENYLISGMDQRFSRALRAKKVSVDELSASSLCGQGVDHWMQVDDSARNSIGSLKNINGHASIIVNDTIVIESDLLIKELNARRINGIDWKDFLANAFTIGQEQTIRGDVRYEGIVQVTRLHSDQVNNASASDLITKPSNQSLREVFIDRLQVKQLYVQRINGVPIDAAARMSRENLIKGKLTLAKLVVTDELTAEADIVVPLTQPTQEYDQIRIDGHVFLKNLELEEPAALNLTGEALTASVRQLVAGSWTKTTDQVIEAPVGLRRGASIDRLHCRRLNGLAERDFLYTDSAQLTDLENVTFANFHFGRVLGQSPRANHSSRFVEESNDRLTFRRAVRMRHLAVDRLFADEYNGIPIESIMRPSELLQLPDDFRFEAVRVAAQMSARELFAARLNSRSVAEALVGALRTDSAANLDGLPAVDSARLASPHLRVANLNGRDLDALLADLEALPPLLSSGANGPAIELRIEGRVAVDEDLRVDRIDGEEASDYASRMRVADPSSWLHVESLVNLTVVQELEVAQLNGQRLNHEFFRGALSRSRQQALDGPLVAFRDARIGYLTADAVNGFDLSKLIYVDGPAVVYGNASFSHLCVDGQVSSRTFNGQQASSKLRRLPANSGMANLLVQGDVEWDEPSSESRSLARLLDDAVTKHERQLVPGPVAFDGPVLAESLYWSEDAGGSEICRRIGAIVSDAVVDVSSHPIVVRGTKIFKRGLVAGDLEVDGNVDIQLVNGLDIRRVGSQVFQKGEGELVTAHVTFLESVQIARLVAQTNIHGVALEQLALVGQRMPKKLHFRHLHVDGRASLRKLDGLDFDDFIKRRVTLDQDNEIFVEAQFDHSVRVANGTVVASVNQVVPENLIQSNADGVPIVVHGNKVFRSRLDVEQSLETPLVNGLHVDSIYGNSVLNGANADILGSLIFEGDVEMSGNVSVAGEIEGLELGKTYLPDRSLESSLSKGSSLLDSSLDGMERETRTAFAASVLYLEEERKLDWHLAGVQSIKSPPAKRRTRLEIVAAADNAELCGLPSDCSCRKQYIVDVLPSGEYEIQELNANNVSHSLYLPEAPYGLEIINRWASYSEQCSSRDSDHEHEHSKIFWVELADDHRRILRRTAALQINGYISDAHIFQVDDQLYLIVAIFYDKVTRSHATDSLLYQFDWTDGKASLIQRIPTDGAKTVNLFQIPKVGMHVLIGCVKGTAESLLLRFNPITRQFQMIRTFATGGSKHVESVSSNDQTFVILSNPDVRALQIFNYENYSDTFVDYQILFFESRVTSLGVFYGGDFGRSDAFVVTTTKDGWLSIYEYMFYGKFRRKMSHWADDIQVLTPFRHMGENYLFAGFKFNSTVYKVIQQGY